MKSKSLVKLGVLFAISVLIFIGSTGLNLFAHEAGHYLVAEAYGFSPELHVNEPASYVQSFWSMDSNIAYVSYNAETRYLAVQDFWIALAGPMVNLLLFSLSLLAYKKSSRKVAKMLLIFPIVTSFISFVANMVPVAPSDGYILLQFLG